MIIFIHANEYGGDRNSNCPDREYHGIPFVKQPRLAELPINPNRVYGDLPRENQNHACSITSQTSVTLLLAAITIPVPPATRLVPKAANVMLPLEMFSRVTE